MFLRHYRLCRAGVIALLFAAVPATSDAMEGGQSPYIKGYRDFLTGVLPREGVQVRHDLYFYNGTERSTLPQGQLTLGVRQVSNILGITVVTPYRIFGGDFGFALRGGVTGVEADQTIVTRLGTSKRNGSLTALNDVALNPFIIGWHAGNFHWNVTTTVFMPAGNYDKNRIANTGRNAWALSPQFGLTHFDPSSGWEVSGAAIYVNSFANTDTNYRSGDIVHVEYAVGKMLTPQFKIGAVGYYAQQLSADSGAGATLGSRKLRVAAIGPGVTFTFTVNDTIVYLVAKYYRE